MSPAACNSWGIHNRCGAALDTAAATDKHGNASMLVCRLMRRFMQGLCRAYAAVDVGLQNININLKAPSPSLPFSQALMTVERQLLTIAIVTAVQTLMRRLMPGLCEGLWEDSCGGLCGAHAEAYTSTPPQRLCGGLRPASAEASAVA